MSLGAFQFIKACHIDVCNFVVWGMQLLHIIFNGAYFVLYLLWNSFNINDRL